MGGRWDVERLIRDVFMFSDNESAQGLSGIKVEPFLVRNDTREDWIADGNGWLLVHRRGGATNQLSGVDKSVTELAALTNSRDRSIELIEYVTDVMLGFGDEGGVVQRSQPHRCGLSTTFMTVPGEVVGPQFIPEQMRDERYVSTTWEIHADRPGGLPNYRESLGLDQTVKGR